MALNLEASNKAPALPIELTQDLMDAFEIVSNVFGGSALGQASMKAMQCLPLAWACLAIKEAGKKAKDVRNREASRSYQEVALLDFIKLCHSNLFRLVADALYVVSTSIFGVVCVVWGSRV